MAIELDHTDEIRCPGCLVLTKMVAQLQEQLNTKTTKLGELEARIRFAGGAEVGGTETLMDVMRRAAKKDPHAEIPDPEAKLDEEEPEGAAKTVEVMDAFNYWHETDHVTLEIEEVPEHVAAAQAEVDEETEPPVLVDAEGEEHAPV